MMGNIFDTPRDVDTSETDEIDFAILQEYRNIPQSKMQRIETDSKVDAAVSSVQTLKIRPISEQQLYTMNSLLDLYEKVSLVFLLGTHTSSLIVMKNLKTSEDEFLQFLSHIIRQFNGPHQIIEALCVIQNYEVLKMLDYNKEQLIMEFSPKIYHTSIYISKTRKLLYRIIENLNEEEEKRVKQLIKDDVIEADFSSFEFFEMYLAYLLETKYIPEDNLANFKKHFKVLEMDHYVNLLSVTEAPSHKTKNVGKTNLNIMYNESSTILNTDKSTAKMGMASGMGPSVERKRLVSISQSSDVYPIDESNPGIVLIIENIDFYEEDDDTYKDLVIRTATTLERRDGSIHDSRRIASLFKRFGYSIIYQKNLTHIQMGEVIKEVAHREIQETQSSFILVMLSHGLENRIIGCNSVPLNVDEIKRQINSKVLEGKPKILIFQACQGNQIMREGRNVNVQPNDITTDGPKQLQPSDAPWQRHILEMWSTVPGYASFRSMSKGSWLIQTLCDVLESDRRVESFAEICTHVNREIGKRWVEYEANRVNVMVPNYISTLDKKFFLPALKKLEPFNDQPF